MPRTNLPIVRSALAAIACGAFVLLTPLAASEPIPVELVIDAGSAHLQREGAPFPVKGAGGDAPFAILAEHGGNTARTWGVGADTRAILDDAHANGLAVAFGIWLGHERHGFDYSDPTQTAAQLEAVRQAVLEYRDHPAVLVWGLGNEMEGFAAGDNPAIWDHIEDCAALVKSLDPDHPTMTTVAEIGGARVPMIHQRCPSIDIVGINSYGGITSIPQRYAAAGGTKPYMITEFGIWGEYETARTNWDEPYEPSSTTKGPVFANAYQTLATDPLCLGSIAFIWGEKREATVTWHGMFLETGEKLQAVDNLSFLWKNAVPDNLSPTITTFSGQQSAILHAGDTFRANIGGGDPNGDPLTYEYRLLGETSGGDFGDEAPPPPDYSQYITQADRFGVTFTAPPFGGPLRLYAFVRDGRGAAATANIPVFIINDGTPPADLPAFVYSDGESSPWTPSGYMGDAWAISMDTGDTTDPRTGDTALRVAFNNPGGWGGVVWQSPANNWGSVDGGIDLTGATSLRFWAKGDAGGEVVTFGFGIVGVDAAYPDSAQNEIQITLTDSWKPYSIPTQGLDMSSILSGFYWVVGGQGAPFAFHLDDIRFEGCRYAPVDINGMAYDLDSIREAIASGEPTADLDGDGLATFFDLLEFLALIDAACP